MKSIYMHKRAEYLCSTYNGLPKDLNKNNDPELFYINNHIHSIYRSARPHSLMTMFEMRKVGSIWLHQSFVMDIMRWIQLMRNHSGSQPVQRRN